MNEQFMQSLYPPLDDPDSQDTRTHTPTHKKQWEGTIDIWHLFFHKQVFVFMSIKKTRIQLNEANEEAPHLALLV